MHAGSSAYVSQYLTAEFPSICLPNATRCPSSYALLPRVSSSQALLDLQRSYSMPRTSHAQRAKECETQDAHLCSGRNRDGSLRFSDKVLSIRTFDLDLYYDRSVKFSNIGVRVLCMKNISTLHKRFDRNSIYFDVLRHL